ncbi:MAG: RGCVC family protein [Blastococcus sp.]
MPDPTFDPAPPPGGVRRCRMTVPTVSTMISTADEALPRFEGERPLDATTQFDAACDVCPHPLAGHDAIGLRYCRATLAGAFTRGCVCRIS